MQAFSKIYLPNVTVINLGKKYFELENNEIGDEGL
jgi:hypothetical protein